MNLIIFIENLRISEVSHLPKWVTVLIQIIAVDGNKKIQILGLEGLQILFQSNTPFSNIVLKLIKSLNTEKKSEENLLVIVFETLWKLLG